MAVLRICLDGRLISGSSGGVEQVVIGLASALSKLPQGEEEYFFLTYRDRDEWLRPYVRGPCHMLPGPPAPHRPTRAWLAKRVPRLQDLYHRFRHLGGSPLINIEKSDGTIEQARIDVMHFTLQTAFLTHIPSIYQPHDLQHLHLPQFFSHWQRTGREVRYRAFCAQAQMVVAMSAWGKADLIRQYDLPAKKVVVVPWGPALTAYPSPRSTDLCAVADKFDLPEAFLFYPAATWPHKNHLGLLQALFILRDQHALRVALVCSGLQNRHFREIKQQVRNLKLQDQVRFLGFVTPLELHCLYVLCRGAVYPSRFEGFGLPVIEAQLAGAPVACSNLTSLPEVAGDGALTFDPEKPQEIAEATLRVWRDETLRRRLVERGRANVARFSWDRSVRIFRAHYRRLANRPLTDEDRSLMEATPVRRILEEVVAPSRDLDKPGVNILDVLS